MRKVFFLAATLLSILCHGQSADIKRLMADGISLHDRGYYEDAISKYDSVLLIDAKYYDAHYEKGYTYLAMNRYDDCINIYKHLLEIAPDNPNNAQLFINWGTALDEKGDPEGALAVYDDGIRRYPDVYLLSFNKAVTLAGLKRNAESVEWLEKTLRQNPLHPGSHHAMAQLFRDNRIASMLSLFTFLILEPQGNRAQQDYTAMKACIRKGITDSAGGTKTTIAIDAGLLDKKNAKRENDFSDMELMFSLASAADNTKEYKDKNAAEKLEKKMDLLIGMFSEKKKEHSGFYWDFYAPFFQTLRARKYLLTACYLVSLNEDEAAVTSWLNSNKPALEDFYKWVSAYKWGNSAEH